MWCLTQSIFNLPSCQSSGFLISLAMIFICIFDYSGSKIGFFDHNNVVFATLKPFYGISRRVIIAFKKDKGNFAEEIELKMGLLTGKTALVTGATR